MPSLHDIRRAHGEAELVIAFTIADDGDYSEFSVLIKENIGRLIETFNAGLRFAGGELFIGTKGEFASVDYGVSVATDWADILTQMMRAYPTRGQLIESKHKMLSGHAKKLGITTLNALFDLCIKSKRETYAPATIIGDLAPQQNEGIDVHDTSFDDFDDTGEDVAFEDVEDEYLGLLMPAATGFHEICGPRDEQYFVESVLSLVRARVLPSIKRDLLDARADWGDHFWKWSFVPEHHLHHATNFNS